MGSILWDDLRKGSRLAMLTRDENFNSIKENEGGLEDPKKVWMREALARI